MGLTNAVDQWIDQSYQDLLAQGLGVQFQPYNPLTGTGTGASASGQIYATALYATAGASITGVKVRVHQAAAGTLPTLVRFGLADSTGKTLVLSGNLNALANWALGVQPQPFTAPYTLPYSGIYFPLLIVVGTWSVTQPIIIVSAGAAGGLPADGSNPPPSFTVAGQSDLPAIGSSSVMTNTASAARWLALY